MNYDQFYFSKEKFIFLYETKEAAKLATSIWGESSKSSSNEASAVYGAQWLAKEIKSTVSCIKPNEPILIVKREKRYWQVVVGEKIGWIKSTGWPIFLKELTND